MKKQLVLLALLMGFTTIPAFSKVENVRARELAKANNIEITIGVSKEVNAFATSEGDIVFLQGLLDLPSLTEDQFLLVLFHEKAHLNFEHPQKTGQLLQILAILQSTVKPDKYLSVEMYNVINLGFNLLWANFSRIQERQADNESFLKLKSLGKNDSACKIFKEALKDSGKRYAFDDHDSSEDRYDACEKILGK